MLVNKSDKKIFKMFENHLEMIGNVTGKNVNEINKVNLSECGKGSLVATVHFISSSYCKIKSIKNGKKY